jgi:hypothetical protein
MGIGLLAVCVCVFARRAFGSHMTYVRAGAPLTHPLLGFADCDEHVKIGTGCDASSSVVVPVWQAPSAHPAPLRSLSLSVRWEGTV